MFPPFINSDFRNRITDPWEGMTYSREGLIIKKSTNHWVQITNQGERIEQTENKNLLFAFLSLPGFSIKEFVWNELR